jgi:hypothetical protein
MNSEQLNVINDVIQDINIPDPLDIKFNKLSNDMNDLVKSPAWQQLVLDWTKLREQLVNLLLEAKTIKEMQGLQNRIKDLDLIIASPKKHLRQSEIYLKRRHKW